MSDVNGYDENNEIENVLNHVEVDEPDNVSNNINSKIPIFKYDITHEEKAFYNETLANMRKDNLNRIDSVTPFDYHFFKKKYVNYIFTMAQRLNLSAVIRYQALYLFDRFYSRHIEGAFGAVCAAYGGTQNGLFSKDWENVESRISRQLTLRIMSCFQICLKTFDCKDILSPGYTARCLKTLGHSYTKDAILKSELKVILTVEFKLWDRENPLVYTETLLAVLCAECKYLESTMSLLYEKCIFVMDYIILNLHDIFNFILMDNFNRTIGNIEQLRFNRLLSDWLLWTSSAIYCASLTMGYTKYQSTEMLKILSTNTMVPIDDIKKFSNAILKKIGQLVDE